MKVLFTEHVHSNSHTANFKAAREKLCDENDYIQKNTVVCDLQKSFKSFDMLRFE